MLLAIETATSICSVALLKDNQIIAEQSAHTKQRHNETLPIITAQLLNQAGITHSQIEQIAVSIGPGSFTGLRVGLSFAKGLALSLNARLIPIETLDALALHLYRLHLRNCNDSDRSNVLICPLTIARKGEVFGRLYRYTDKLTTESELFFGDGETVRDHIGDKSVVVGGEGADMLLDQLANCDITQGVHTSASTVGQIALKHPVQSNNHAPYDSIEPMYLKEFTIKTKRTP